MCVKVKISLNLFLFCRYQAFIVAADDSEQEKCRERMQLLIQDLPDTNYETLKAVIMHLKHVAEHGEHNRMDARYAKCIMERRWKICLCYLN